MAASRNFSDFSWSFSACDLNHVAVPPLLRRFFVFLFFLLFFVLLLPPACAINCAVSKLTRPKASDFLDFGFDVQESLDAPRTFAFDNKLSVEQGVSSDVINGLSHLGHEVEIEERPIGGGQAIWIDWETGVLTGGSDPRKDGCALGY